MSTIEQRQRELIDQFQMLDGDMEMTLQYIMELGQALPEMGEAEKIDDHIVKGCQSKVWLTASGDDQQVQYHADSNTAITKGLVSMLLKVINGMPAKKILDADFFFPEKIGMNRFIGTQRSNGFAAMIKQIKYYALAIHQREKAHG